MNGPRGGTAPITALILSGGGACGAYEVGVMRALFEGKCPSNGFRKLEPEFIAGTSVGAINASFILSSPASSLDRAIAHLEHIYLKHVATTSSSGHTGVIRLRANPLRLLHASEWLLWLSDVAGLSSDIVLRLADAFSSPEPLEDRIIDLADLSLLIDTSALRRLITRFLNPPRILASGRRLRIIATDWKEGTVRVFRAEDLTNADAAVETILASAALPGIISQISVGGTPYADGGIVMNSALKPAIDEGAEEIHLVYVDPAIGDIPIDTNAGTVGIFMRALAIALASMLNRDVESAARVNLGIDLLRDPSQTSAPADETGKAVTHLLARVHQRTGKADGYRRISLHRYRPDRYTSGTIQWLDFSRERVAQMMEMGYVDALHHDCTRQQCIL